MSTIYVSIGNSDDRLTQAQWFGFWSHVDRLVRGAAVKVHGAWVSPTAAPWQNACWCFDIGDIAEEELRRSLAIACTIFHQDSIAWAPAVTEFLTAGASV